jgi:predicted ATPase
MHVDEAIGRFENEGLSLAQNEALLNTPGLEPAFRGSRIDQFAKDTIMQDLELADAITAPDFISEPDILISSIDEWFDITTPNAWQDHLLRYMERYGAAARLLPTRP